MARERLREKPHGGGAVVAQRDTVAVRARDPRRLAALASAGPGADAGDQGVALGEGLGVGAPGRGARRPESGDDLVEMGAAQAGRALDELQAVGQEDAEQRPVRSVEQTLDGRSVRRDPLRLARLEADGAARGGRRASSPSTHDARRARAEADDLALVRSCDSERAVQPK